VFDDIRVGEVDIERRPTDDVGRLLDSTGYAIKRAAVNWVAPWDRFLHAIGSGIGVVPATRRFGLSLIGGLLPDWAYSRLKQLYADLRAARG
jgi:hypothetical protein